MSFRTVEDGDRSHGGPTAEPLIARDLQCQRIRVNSCQFVVEIEGLTANGGSPILSFRFCGMDEWVNKPTFLFPEGVVPP